MNDTGQDMDARLTWLDARQRLHDESVRRLLCAVLAQAALDAHDGGKDALEWFRGPIAGHYCQLLNLDHKRMVYKLDNAQVRRVVQKPTYVGRTATDEYRRRVMDRYDEWRRMGQPLSEYAQHVGIKPATLKTQFYKFGLSVAYERAERSR